MGKFFSNPHQYAKFQLVSTHKEVTEIMKALKTGKNVRSPYGNSFSTDTVSGITDISTIPPHLWMSKQTPHI